MSRHQVRQECDKRVTFTLPILPQSRPDARRDFPLPSFDRIDKIDRLFTINLVHPVNPVQRFLALPRSFVG